MSFMVYPQPDACRALMPTPEPAPPGPPSRPMVCHMPAGHEGPHAIIRRPGTLDRRWEGDARPMTAPAEDPRGGERRRFRECAEAFGIEGEYDPACCRFPKSCSPYPYQEAIDAGNVAEADLEPPAAGRGDTDSGGEACDGCKAGGGHFTDCPQFRARSAGDRAQPTEEVREAIKDTLILYGINGERLGSLRPGSVADTLLAGPLAALLDAQAAVSRAKVLIDHPGLPDATCRKLVRRALDGTT